MTSNSQKITYYQNNGDTLLQRSKDYYEKNKDKRKEYQINIFNEISLEKRNKLNEYQKNGIIN